MLADRAAGDDCRGPPRTGLRSGPRRDDGLDSGSRYCAWIRAEQACDLDDRSVNDAVDPLFDGEKPKRILALVEVSYSNSIIEASWRSLRHQWLFLHHLDTIGTVRKLTPFYVHQHNTVMPHSVFDGQTPDEMYFGRGESVPDELHARGLEARRRRIPNSGAACPRRSLDSSHESAA